MRRFSHFGQICPNRSALPTKWVRDFIFVSETTKKYLSVSVNRQLISSDSALSTWQHHKLKIFSLKALLFMKSINQEQKKTTSQLSSFPETFYSPSLKKFDQHVFGKQKTLISRQRLLRALATQNIREQSQMS